MAGIGCGMCASVLASIIVIAVVLKTNRVLGSELADNINLFIVYTRTKMLVFRFGTDTYRCMQWCAHN